MVHKKEKFNGKEYNILEHKGGFAGTSSQFIKIIEPNTWIVYFNNSYDTYPDLLDLLSSIGSLAN